MQKLINTVHCWLSRYFLITTALMFICFLMACNDDEDPRPKEYKASDLWLWELDLDEDYALDFNAYQWEDLYIIKGRNKATSVDELVAIDSNNGEIKWIWSDWSNSLTSTYNIDVVDINNEYILMSSPLEGIYLIDPISGATLSEITEETSNENNLWGRAYFAEDKIIVPIVSQDPSSLFEFHQFYFWDHISNQLDYLAEIEYFTGYRAISGKPILESTINGDTIMYVEAHGSTRLGNYFAFNLSADTLLWSKTHLIDEPRNYSNETNPIILGDQIIFYDNLEVRSFDKIDGRPLWSNEYTNDRFNFNAIYFSDTLAYINTNMVDFINLNNGNTIHEESLQSSNRFISKYKNQILIERDSDGTTFYNVNSLGIDFFINHEDKPKSHSPLTFPADKLLIYNQSNKIYCYEYPE